MRLDGESRTDIGGRSLRFSIYRRPLERRGEAARAAGGTTATEDSAFGGRRRVRAAGDAAPLAARLDCVGCGRGVASDALRPDALAAFVGWVRDTRGRWLCTECQLRSGRIPPLFHRVERPLIDAERRRLRTESERWERRDMLLFWGLLALLGFVAGACLALAVLL